MYNQVQQFYILHKKVGPDFSNLCLLWKSASTLPRMPRIQTLPIGDVDVFLVSVVATTGPRRLLCQCTKRYGPSAATFGTDRKFRKNGPYFDGRYLYSNANFG